ncbi:MAG: winged helix-turn-helix domain-containing protein [Myxococcota bacterium]|nr:winged helix-turn-helix domain-containing protein [Myxococcota bacterium]
MSSDGGSRPVTARVLAIEDDADLRHILEYNLRQAGHEPLVASRGEDGLRIARERRPDVVLLDLMLPDIPGTEVCKALRADPSTRDAAIVMLTARGEEIDRVVGFELGADDYVVKPFSVRELLLRIQAVLRRRFDERQTARLVEFGRLRIDRAAHDVRVDGRKVELTVLEFRLLVTLHERRNRVQTRAALLDDVWGVRADVETRTVDAHVKRLREKLGGAGAYIETVRGVGYRFAEHPREAGR